MSPSVVIQVYSEGDGQWQFLRGYEVDSGEPVRSSDPHDALSFDVADDAEPDRLICADKVGANNVRIIADPLEEC